MSNAVVTRPAAGLYIGKCKTKGCRHSTRAHRDEVQHLDSGRKARNAQTGELVLIDAHTLLPYDRSRPFIFNGIAVSAKCPEHGVYRLQPVKGRVVPDHKCDARCTSATGPKCDCSCGGANHGANHA